MGSKVPEPGGLERALAVCWAASMILFGIVTGAALAHGGVIPGESGEMLRRSDRWLAAALYWAQVSMIVSGISAAVLAVIVFTRRGSLELDRKSVV